jgi:cyclohexa-1,5-dienecarbonyl-CoA hydratase
MSDSVRVRCEPGADRASVVLFHPKGNIVTAEMVSALSAALARLAGEPHLKLITIEGAGADFSFGASIPEHTPEEIPRVLPGMHALILAMLDVPVVTAAVVRGRCLGGGFELALACDFLFAGTSASFALPEVALGVFPPAAAALLPARVGTARATQAIVTGAAVSAADWHHAGLVSLMASDADLAVRVDRWFATHLAPKSAAALRYATLAARRSLRAHVAGVLPELEKLYLNGLMRTEDAAEGVAAFLGKRLPNWKDR